MIGSKSAPPIGSGAKLYEKLLALLMAVALCVGLMPAVAFADEGADVSDPLAGDKFPVALTIVDQTDPANPVVIKNEKVSDMTSDMTVEDMLKAAGLAKVSTLEETVGDSTKFFLQYDSPYFLGKEYDAGTRCYWQTIFNGSSSGWESAMSYAKLQPGGHYQYIYGNTGSFAYDTFIFDPLAGESFSVALTVVDQVNKETPIVFNQKLPGMTSDMTVEDMLKAAGLAKVSTLEETVGDSTKYCDVNGSPYFLGKEYDAGTRCYWQTIFNGSSSGYASALLDAKLQPGGHYQYIYGNSGSFSYGKNGEVIEYAVNKYNADDAASLIANLSKRFSAGGDEAAISNETFSAALALNMLDLGSFVDRAAIQKNMDEDAEMTAGRLAKYIMALENAGVDCTQTTYKGEAANLFTEMKAMAEASGSLDDVYSLVLMVAAYGYCGDAQNDGVEFAKKLIVEAGNISDVQTSAQCIIALIPYKDLEGAQAAIDAAAANIGYSQLPDGGFSYMLYGNESNLDATADAVVALTALGKDVNSTDFMTVIGSTPVGYLVGVADSGLSSYYSASPATEEMSASVALAGLVAYASSCNVYDVKDVVVDQPESPSGSTSQPGNTLAQSGDGMMACAGAAGVLALGAICTLVVTRRKMAVAQDARDIVLK